MKSGIRLEPLHRRHEVQTFDSGRESLNRFLIQHALQSQQANSSRTYVILDEMKVVAFYSLAFGQLEHADAPERLTTGVARHPILVMLLARLAVSADRHGAGLGAALMKDAAQRTLQAADIAGLRALLVHAKDQNAVLFYKRFGFLRSPTEAFHLALPLKDMRAQWQV